MTDEAVPEGGARSRAPWFIPEYRDSIHDRLPRLAGEDRRLVAVALGPVPAARVLESQPRDL